MKAMTYDEMQQVEGGMKLSTFLVCAGAGAAIGAAFLPGGWVATIMYGPALTAGCVSTFIE